MERNDLFSIGDMARMFHLSVGSLRHYEAMGLVTPEYVDPDTGYRYYSARQFEPLNTIRYLRALDMPLPQIAAFLHNKEIDVIEEMLRRQKQTVAQKQQQLAVIQRKIENRLRQLQDARASRLDEITLRQLPACRLAWLECALQIKSALDMERPIRRLEERQPETAVFLGKVGVGISAQNLCAGAFEQYDGVFLLLDEEDRFDGRVERLPAVTAVSVRFCGSHTESPAQYRKLMDYLAGEGLSVAGFSREITMIDYGLTNDPAQFVTEISIPVERR